MSDKFGHTFISTYQPKSLETEKNDKKEEFIVNRVYIFYFAISTSLKFNFDMNMALTIVFE